MDNKTPPAWAINMVTELYTLSKYDLQYDSLVFKNKVTEVVMRHAPDAEALAEALESLIAHAIEHHVISPVDESVAVIAAYRARFPKAEVTP